MEVTADVRRAIGGAMNRRDFLRWGAGALTVGTPIATVFYTFRIEPHWVEVVDHELAVDGLPSALAGANVVQISDLHIGPRVSDDYIIESLRRVASLRPDILVITGDLISIGTPDPIGKLRGVLAHLPTGRLATVGILGNHDYGFAWREPAVANDVASALSDAGVRVLRNERIDVGGLSIVGVDDLWALRAAPASALAGIGRKPTIALCHNPDTLDEKSWAGYRGWVLAGHTHGGQCKPPFLPPPLLPVRNKRYTSGEIAIADGRRLYINRGLGHLLKVRFNVRPEITVHRLVPVQ